MNSAIDDILHKIAESIVRLMPEEEDPAVRAQAVSFISDNLMEKFPASIPLRSGENLAVSLNSPKTTSLFYDRVWAINNIEDNLPQDIVFFGGSPGEVWLAGVMQMVSVLLDINHTPNLQSAVFYMKGELLPTVLDVSDGPASHRVAKFVGQEFRVRTTPVYGDWENLDGEFPPGDAETLILAIEGLNIIDENELTWEQVKEIRNDRSSRIKISNLIKLASKELAGASVFQMRSELESRLDDYEYSLKKHGVKTALGCMAELLDPKFVLAASGVTAGLAVGGAGPWAALGAGGLAVGRTTVSLGQRLIALDEQRRRGSEVAFLHQIGRRSP